MFITFGLFSTIFVCTASQPFPPPGVAAWVYDADKGAPAMWASDIGAFNQAAKAPISVIFTYGGDMEYYPSLPQPYQVYFPANNQAAASLYNSTPGECAVAVWRQVLNHCKPQPVSVTTYFHNSYLLLL